MSYCLFICVMNSPLLAKLVTPRFVQCHGNQTTMCMNMRLLWPVCLDFVGPMDPFLIRVRLSFSVCLALSSVHYVRLCVKELSVHV